jgi:uncharacterized protein with FMN-binding domain
MTKRAIGGTFLAAVALVLLLSFKTPEAAGLGGGSSPGSTIRSGYSGQLTGSSVDTPFGTVQVQVTLQNGQLTDIQALQLPAGGHSGQVSQFAEPQLRSEVLSAQSSQVNTISGATYTSQAYLQSLQSALDQAGSGFSGAVAAANPAATLGSAGVAADTPSGTSSGAGAGSGTGAGAATTSPSLGTGSSKSYTGTLTGSAIQMPYGIIQVQVKLQNGRITDVQTLQAPSRGHSGQVAQFAAPVLRSEVLSAQSSGVNTVSGATYTSQAYLQSLQSALDQAA